MKRKKKKVVKKAKKRPSKYDEKFVFDGTFDQILNALIPKKDRK